MIVTKKSLNNLVEDVVEPILTKIEKSSKEDFSIASEDKQFRRGIIRLVLDSITMLGDETDLDYVCQKVAKDIFSCIKDELLALEVFQYTVYLLIKFSAKYEKFELILDNINRLDEYEKIFLKKFLNLLEGKVSVEDDFIDFSDSSKEQCAESEDDSSDDFFDFDSEDVDESIKEMHTDHLGLIDAKTFMESSYIEPDDIADLQDVLNMYDQYILTEFTDEYQELVIEVLRKLSVILARDDTFKNLSDSCTVLGEKLEEIDADSLNKEESNLYFQLIDSIIKDIENFTKTVLVEQSAKDIHYLDAALFANISQFEILCKNK